MGRCAHESHSRIERYDSSQVGTGMVGGWMGVCVHSICTVGGACGAASALCGGQARGSRVEAGHAKGAGTGACTIGTRHAVLQIGYRTLPAHLPLRGSVFSRLPHFFRASAVRRMTNPIAEHGAAQGQGGLRTRAAAGAGGRARPRPLLCHSHTPIWYLLSVSSQSSCATAQPQTQGRDPRYSRYTTDE